MRTFLLLTAPDLAALSPLLDSSSPPQAAKSSAPAANAASAAVSRDRPFTSVLPSGVLQGRRPREARTTSPPRKIICTFDIAQSRWASRRLWSYGQRMEAVIL